MNIKRKATGILRAGFNFTGGETLVNGAANNKPKIFAMLRIAEKITVVSGFGNRGSVQYLKA